MGIVYLKGLVRFSVLISATFYMQLISASEISGKISKLDNAENIAFLGATSWDYRIKKLPGNKIKITLPASSSPQFVNSAKKWRGKFIKDIKVSKNNEIESELIITMGKTATYFDYLTDQPSSLVIDFYRDSKKKVIVKKAKPKKVAVRKPASTEFIKFDSVKKEIDQVIIKGGNEDNSLLRHGVFDSADPGYSRFDIKKSEFDYDTIQKNLKKSVFIRLPILFSNSSQLSSLLEDLPLHVIRTKNKHETKEAQLLHRLYKAKSWAAFNKMYEYFQKTYPTSKYVNLLRSLATSTYFNMWQATNNKKYLLKAEKEFLKFKEDRPASRVTEYWDKIIFYTNLELNQGLNAARIGEELVSKYPLANDIENIKLSLADAYLKSTHYKEADNIYNDLKSNAKSPEIRKIASFTQPILNMKQKKMKEAVEQYLDVRKNYNSIDDPGYYFNMGEAYFWKGDYYRSAQLFKQFIKKYPKHLMNNFAITRIAEIMQLIGLDKKRYGPVFFESNYRYKGLKGADIAKIRLNSLKIKNSKK